MHRNLTLSLASFLLTIAAQAQITIGQNEMPHANDELLRTRAFTNPFIDYATTGAAHVWDFSNLTVNTADTAEYLTVASTNFVYAITYADLFFNPNRANHAKHGVDVPFNQFLPISDPYTFLYRSSSVYRKVGYGVELAGLPVPILMEDQDVIYELPVQFGDSTADFSSYNLDIPGLGYYGFSQDRTNEVDGWGAITTPAGSFDVLRVKTTLEITDSIAVDSLGVGFSVDRPVVREYKWLAQGLRVPVLQINTTELFGFQVVNAIYYYDVPRTLEVVQPLASTICPGATVNVPYEATGAYNAGGFLIQANHFIAQLSDANGDFTTPVDVGDTNATGSGVMSATIPANTPLGSGYRIRVISTSPDFIGTDNGFDITIGGATTASISAGGSTLICTGDSVVLTAVGGPSYKWQVGGFDIPGATSSTLVVNGAGYFTVVVDNACGTATSNAIQVDVNDPPVFALDTMSATICAGSTFPFTALDQSGQGALTYQWYLNNAPIAGATDTIVDATLAGAYTFEATNGNTGCSFLTSAAMLIVENVDAPVVTAQGDTTFCDGGSVQLDATAAPGNTLQWYQDGQAVAGADSTSLMVGTAGTYTVVASNANNCASDVSNSIVVAVDSVPALPGITAGGPLSVCDSGTVLLSIDPVAGATYQWSFDGVDIAGADSTWLTADSTGTYAVVVTSGNGCSSGAASVAFAENASPAVPVIMADFDTLMIGGSGDFQWYLDGQPIAGATDSAHIAVANGTYTVTITDGDGCASTSDPYVWLSTTVGDGPALSFSAHPNPTSGPLVLNLDRTPPVGSAYQVFDIAGHLVLQGSISSTRTDLLLEGASGVYSVRASLGTVAVVKSVVLMR
ncbi:MAG: hypothetical protein IPJ76_18685 [Flavobacteriales bacterium]|nr:MAG: hypothetical protein IPJ76_18685 [Flavobacteriales bacterium]